MCRVCACVWMCHVCAHMCVIVWVHVCGYMMCVRVCVRVCVCREMNVNHRHEKLYTTAKISGTNGLMDVVPEPDPHKIERRI